MRIGIIPALAGNTWSAFAAHAASWDHPRACGEHYDGDTPDVWLSGSSPRLRGTRALGARHARRRGIIPALAGNTVRN